MNDNVKKTIKLFLQTFVIGVGIFCVDYFDASNWLSLLIGIYTNNLITIIFEWGN